MEIASLVTPAVSWSQLHTELESSRTPENLESTGINRKPPIMTIPRSHQKKNEEEMSNLKDISQKRIQDSSGKY